MELFIGIVLILVKTTVYVVGSLIALLIGSLLVIRGEDIIHAIFYSKEKRIQEATQLLASLWEVDPHQLVYKEDEQLKKYFTTKGQLYYHVFTPEGECYVQFLFKGNDLIDFCLKEESTLNVFTDTSLQKKLIPSM